MSTQLETAIEVWVLLAVNFLGFLLGLLITAMSYAAYRSKRSSASLRNATIGFAFLTLGTAIDPTSRAGIPRAEPVTTEHTVALQLLEGSAMSLGFLILFFSVLGYSAGPQRRTIRPSGAEDLLEEPD